MHGNSQGGKNGLKLEGGKGMIELSYHSCTRRKPEAMHKDCCQNRDAGDR